MNTFLGLTLIGIISGLAAGFIGAGAEVLIVPLLTVFGLLESLKMRIGTSLFMLLPPIGLFAALKYYKNGFVNVKAALYMALIFTIFASVSSEYSLPMHPDKVRKIFGIFTILAGLYIFMNKEK
tara:strand:+ start:134 stop:505 length:372 start_codon:yes stop_codon:yes gene_type:complete